MALASQSKVYIGDSAPGILYDFRAGHRITSADVARLETFIARVLGVSVSRVHLPKFLQLGHKLTKPDLSHAHSLVNFVRAIGTGGGGGGIPVITGLGNILGAIGHWGDSVNPLLKVKAPNIAGDLGNTVGGGLKDFLGGIFGKNGGLVLLGGGFLVFVLLIAFVKAK